jgi:hypothetical protein
MKTVDQLDARGISMKSLNQLAQSAFAAHQKQQLSQLNPGGTARTWADLLAEEQRCWLAVAKQLWAEFSALY